MNVLVTMPFGEHLLDRMRAVDPSLKVTQASPQDAGYTDVDILYANAPCTPAEAPRLRWVQLHLAGVDALREHPIYTRSNVPLTSTSGVHATATAEYAITAVLALAHRFARMVEWKEKGAWPPDEQRWPLFLPAAVRGKTLGIVGYGSIGREVARLATAAFGMRVLACKRDASARVDLGYALPGTGDPEGLLPDAWFSPGQLPQMLAECDYVVMCAPLTPDTSKLIGARELSAMKESAFLINVGRGGTLDQDAVADALAARRIQGAALDVFEEEPLAAEHRLYALDNVILSPHVSGFMATYDEECTNLFVANLRRFLAGEPLINLVDRNKGY